MAKKKQSATEDLRSVANVAMGGAMVGNMMPLMSNPSAGNIQNATQGAVGLAVVGGMTNVAFNMLDKQTKKQKKSKYRATSFGELW